MNAWLQISSGQGVTECQWVVAKLFEVMNKDATSVGLHLELLETVLGDQQGMLKSALLVVEGGPKGYPLSRFG